MKSSSIKRYDPFRIIPIILFLSVLSIGSFSMLYGQEVRREAPPLKDRLFFGGNVGLQFGTYTNIDVSPIIGLWVMPRVAVAAGPDFRYYKDPYGSTTIFGGKTYLEIILLEDLNNILPLGIHLGLFIHGEYEALSLESAFFNPAPNDAGRFMLNTFLAGGGIRQQLGRRSAMNLTFLWVFNNSDYGIYGNPEIRVSFMF